MTATAQTSATSTPTSPSPAASPDTVLSRTQDLKDATGELRLQLAERQISRLIGELRAGRKLNAAQQTEINALEDRLKAELANSASLEKSYASAVREIDSLRKALDFAQQAIDSQKETIKEVKSQRDEARASAAKANKRAGVAAVVAVILAAIKFL